MQDLLTIENGRISTTNKSLSDDGELDLTFDEWHQAWRRLLELIKAHVTEELPSWQAHYSFILNNDNRAELWPLFLAYDVELRKRSTQSGLDPSQFSIGIWNDLEVRFTAKKVLALVQADLKTQPSLFRSSRDSYRNTNRTSSFWDSLQLFDKFACCFICGDRSKDHTSRNCSATINTSGLPCHLLKQGPFGKWQSKNGNVEAGCYFP